MLVIDYRVNHKSDIPAVEYESTSEIVFIKPNGIVIELPFGFSELPAESVVRLRRPERYPNLQASQAELQSLFAPPATRFQTYIRRFQQSTFNPSTEDIRTRILLIMYSMWMVPGWITDDVLNEISILSNMAMSYFVMSDAGEIKLTELEVFANYIKRLSERERESLASLLESIHIQAMGDPLLTDRYSINMSSAYLAFCTSGENKIKNAVQYSMREISRNRHWNRIKKFRDSHDLVHYLADLEKEGKYVECMVACSRYIDGAIALSKEIGNLNSGEFQIGYYYDRISVYLIRMKDWNAAHERLKQMFSLPKPFLRRCPPSSLNILKKRLDRVKLKIQELDAKIG